MMATDLTETELAELQVLMNDFHRKSMETHLAMMNNIKEMKTLLLKYFAQQQTLSNSSQPSARALSVRTDTTPLPVMSNLSALRQTQDNPKVPPLPLPNPFPTQRHASPASSSIQPPPTDEPHISDMDHILHHTPQPIPLSAPPASNPPTAITRVTTAPIAYASLSPDFELGLEVEHLKTLKHKLSGKAYSADNTAPVVKGYFYPKDRLLSRITEPFNLSAYDLFLLLYHRRRNRIDGRTIDVLPLKMEPVGAMQELLKPLSNAKKCYNCIGGIFGITSPSSGHGVSNSHTTFKNSAAEIGRCKLHILIDPGIKFVSLSMRCTFELNSYVRSRLLDIYACTYDVDSAMRAFLGLTDKNLVCYNCLISKYSKSGQVLAKGNCKNCKNVSTNLVGLLLVCYGSLHDNVFCLEATLANESEGSFGIIIKVSVLASLRLSSGNNTFACEIYLSCQKFFFGSENQTWQNLINA